MLRWCLLAITEGCSHRGNFLIAILLRSQLAKILPHLLGAVVVRFGKEVCVVLQELAANKMLTRKPREKDDYGSDCVMTNLVNVVRQT